MEPQTAPACKIAFSVLLQARRIRGRQWNTESPEHSRRNETIKFLLTIIYIFSGHLMPRR